MTDACPYCGKSTATPGRYVDLPTGLRAHLDCQDGEPRLVDPTSEDDARSVLVYLDDQVDRATRDLDDWMVLRDGMIARLRVQYDLSWAELGRIVGQTAPAVRKAALRHGAQFPDSPWRTV